MKTAFPIAGVVASVVLMASTASAQIYPISGAGYTNYGMYHHASTVEQGVLDGVASVTAARGQANYMHSLAAINYQDAYARALTNRRNYVDTYFYSREANKSARTPHRLSTEKLTALASAAAPDRLSPQDYDSSLGRLNWPAPLLSADFAAERDALECMFRSRSPSDVGSGTEFYAAVKQVASVMQAKLQNHISELDPSQYLTAKKFLLGVSQETTQPMAARALAAR